MKISYQFTVPEKYDRVHSAILQAAELCHCTVKAVAGTGFTFKMSPGSGYFKIAFTVFFSEANGITTLRIVTSGTDRKALHFRVYDRFLTALIRTGLTIPVVPGNPYIVTTLQIGGGTEQRSTSKNKPSWGGAFVGGFLFGDVGALIGGLGGSSSKGTTKTVLSNSALFLICYSNGIIEEREVKKGTRLYTEVMAKLGADPVIHKSNIYTEPQTAARATPTPGQSTGKTKTGRFLHFLLFCLIYALGFVALLFVAAALPQLEEPMASIEALLVLIVPAIPAAILCRTPKK